MTTRIRTPLLLAGVAAALLAAPAQANERSQALRHQPAAADKALRHARAVAAGRTGNKHELTLALADLESRRGALSAAERSEADQLLARPTDSTDGGPGGPYDQDPVAACSTHFCFHWIDDDTDPDAPPLADGPDQDAFPDYVNLHAFAFETAYQEEVVDLGWRAPKSDGTLGGDNRSDVYIKNIGQVAYGYVARDPGQAVVPENGTRYAYLVMDNDYSAAEFPKYGGDPEEPVLVTAAHEFNHVLQNAYDSFEDKWMFESTATWMEEHVHPDIDDYLGYMPSWALRSFEPITAPDNAKIYGSAIWNRWLHDRRTAGVVRRAWEVSFAEGSYAPGAYDQAIRDASGPGFMPEFIDFAVATTEWGAGNSGIHEGGKFGSLARISSQGQPITLPTDGSVLQGALDHTSYAVFDVAASSAPSLEVTGTLPAHTAGAVALVGRTGAVAGGAMTTAVAKLPDGGTGKAVLQNPGQFARISAVIVNADPSASGFDEQTGDWEWTKDDQAIALSVKAASSGGTTPPPPPPPPPPQPNGGGTGTTGGGTTSTGGGTTTLGPSAAAVSLKAGALPKLGAIARAGLLKVTLQADRAGSAAGKLVVDAKTAKALGLGKRAATLGSGKATVAAAGKVALKLKLTARARAALKRMRRAFQVTVRVTFTAPGAAPAAQSLKVKLRP
jgi:hypothetical protein